MSIDSERLRHVVWLATGDPIGRPEADRLARLLSDPAEVLPHLLLRRGGFAFATQMRAALEAAIERSPNRPSSPRGGDLDDAIEGAAATVALREATKAIIDHDIANQDAQGRLDQTLLDLASRRPGDGWDPSVWIRR